MVGTRMKRNTWSRLVINNGHSIVKSPPFHAGVPTLRCRQYSGLFPTHHTRHDYTALPEPQEVSPPPDIAGGKGIGLDEGH